MKSSAREQEWSVGAVGEKFELPTHVLRHWESVGLLHPRRDAADRRRYSRDDLVRVAVIQSNKAAGMSLEQVGVLLDSQAPGRHVLLEEHLAELRRRVAALEAARAMTEHALGCEAHDVTRCPRFRATLAERLGETVGE